MLYLSEAAIDYAITMCATRPMYRVVIATATEQKGQDVLQYIAGSRERSPYRIRRGIDKFAEWQNGSVISTINANYCARGRRAHLVIIDDNISDEVVDTVFRRMEILESVDRNRRRFEEEYDLNRLRTEQGEILWSVVIPEYEEENNSEQESESNIIISENELMKVLGVS